MKHLLSITVLLITLSSTSLSQKIDDTLFVFVGEKISVKRFRPKADSNDIMFNAAFKAKYKVIKSLYGHCSSDTIEFDAYDHYGTPAFSKFKNVLLFVSRYNGKLYHEKYQFFDVYMTNSGRWASSYKPSVYGHSYLKKIYTQPEFVDFKSQVAYKIKHLNKADLNANFPSPYYRIIRNHAIAIFGNFIEELFELKKRSVLKARGFFE